MRYQPTDPWEVEAARRREVIESDFGAPHRSPPQSDGEQAPARAMPLAALMAGITRALQVRSTEPVECLPHGQPGLGAPKPGT
jgi:hypothetical protein